MNENLFDRINIDKKNTYLPNGMAEDEEANVNATTASLKS